MNRADAHPGTTVTWTTTDGLPHQGTILAHPLDREEKVLVAWTDQHGDRNHDLIPLAPLHVIPEPRR